MQIDEHHWEQIQDFHLFTSYLRGEEGTLVQLIVQRGDKKLTFSIKRAKIQIPILHSDPQHCYLQLFNFDEGSAKAFSKTFQSWTACPRYVIDLRSNLGGIIDEALEMLSLFLPEKTPLVTLHSASGIQTRYASAHSSDISPLPLIILIDRNTASAAEIFAGVLKYYFPERVQLIGEASFGKGTVQEIISLPNDALLKYTIALRHIAQQSDSLDHKGLTPDRVAYDDPQTPEDEVLLSI